MKRSPTSLPAKRPPCRIRTCDFHGSSPQARSLRNRRPRRWRLGPLSSSNPASSASRLGPLSSSNPPVLSFEARALPSHLRMRPRGGSGFALAPQHEDGEAKDALAPQNEVAQNLLFLRCEATAEPRRRGGFATAPQAGEREKYPSGRGWRAQSASRVRVCLRLTFDQRGGIAGAGLGHDPDDGIAVALEVVAGFAALFPG
jgi:hypothetical protein